MPEYNSLHMRPWLYTRGSTVLYNYTNLFLIFFQIFSLIQRIAKKKVGFTCGKLFTLDYTKCYEVSSLDLDKLIYLIIFSFIDYCNDGNVISQDNGNDFRLIIINEFIQ